MNWAAITGLWTDAFAYWRSGGMLLLPMAALCFASWLAFLRLRAALLRALVPDDAGAVQRLLAHAARVQAAGGEAGDAFAAAGDAELSRFSRDLALLGALVAAAPLLGLLGTVLGMVETFEAVARAGANTTSKVASGISRALITTQFGLVVALPGVFGIARLRRLLSQLRIACEAGQTRMMLEAGN
jgi:biopolymer transport protein ExbB